MNRREFVIGLSMLVLGVMLGGAFIALASSAEQEATGPWDYFVLKCREPIGCESSLNALEGQEFELLSTVIDDENYVMMFLRARF